MTTLNDIKAAITLSIDPLEEILDDMADMDPMMICTGEILDIIECLETAICYLEDVRDRVLEDLIG